jgi:hypothetical protein
MKKLRTILCAVSALVLASMTTSPLMADSSNFAGPYVGFQIAAVGVELDGKVAEGTTAEADDDTPPHDTDVDGSTTTGNIGRTAIIGGIELGYVIPFGAAGLLLDVGATYVAGGAKIRTNNTDTEATADVIFEVDDLYSLFLAPSFVLSETSSVFIKLGYTHATVSVTGDVTKPDDMEGATYAIGTRTVLESGLFIKSEAGITEFDSLAAKGLGKGGTGKLISTGTTVDADPTIAYGSISIGMRF